MPEGEEEEQEVENLFEQITKENFPNLAKEIDSRKSRKLRELAPKKEVGPKEAHAKVHHNYITQD